MSEPPPDPRKPPLQRSGVSPQMIGRYPDYDVLTEAGHWDAETRRVVLDRVENVPPIRFFTPAETSALTAFCDVVTAQRVEPRVPVLAYIDEKFHDGGRDGWQYFDLPDDDEVWRRTARGLDDEARKRSFESYAAAPHDVQEGIVA